MPAPIGLLNIDKPAGMTSHDVVQHVRRVAGTRRVGHAGTLDPLATGVLLVFIGRATRLIEYVVGQPKTYVASVRLGQETDTYDADGELVAERPIEVVGVDVEAALDQLNRDWERGQERVLDLRFELRDQLTREEWAALHSQTIRGQ